MICILQCYKGGRWCADVRTVRGERSEEEGEKRKKNGRKGKRQEGGRTCYKTMSRATTRQSLKSLLTLSNLAQNQVSQTPLSLSPSSAISTTTMASFQSLKLALLLLLAISDFHAPPFAVNALNIGIQSSDSSIQVSKECSRKCESEFCSVPPFLRYGKYCGLLYSGCPGEKPCDGLDACCMLHDACVQAKNNDYLSQECSQNFVNCMAGFRMAGEHTFKGNKCQVDEVIDVINLVMDAALLAGRVLHKP